MKVSNIQAPREIESRGCLHSGFFTSLLTRSYQGKHGNGDKLD